MNKILFELNMYSLKADFNKQLLLELEYTCTIVQYNSTTIQIQNSQQLIFTELKICK